ncbi:RIP metalloprotease RseP [Candidatus Falkowbacteria bacterium RIFCSPLOWO2_12_FULL_45_13]|uniref:Zinc metalloprotease n=2 Tax=Candidatus Falkowiibacteriota TaxID=1752728 RepID=A0A1F5SD77_9BACT|nr:MAG: RIP metalloprotease RseP [Candidatus Falkowbacteria bacterium RIFCSPLOWO2_02_FULL_45_21]OGF30824.1 MAG: RIP metalloprotease RseP [Candidatus Falkowbacteria bacterium RIFCSPLOWO2_12_FULL_45_13]
MLLTIIIFILVLSILVFAHELGHFMMARKFGVKAEEFGFGFPPRLFGFYKNNQGDWRYVFGGREITDCPGTVYSLNWLPLGGFVKIKGENGEGEKEPDSFAARPVWQRAIILSAGVVMNIILAMVLIIAGFMMGLPQSLEGGLDARAQISDRKIQIVEVLGGSRAQSAGLKIGDTIVSIDNNKFSSFEELQGYVNSKIGLELNYKIERGRETLDKPITPALMPETGKGGIGVAISETGIVSYPWYLAIWQGVKTTFILTWVIITAFYELLKGLIFGQGVTADLAGPVGIAALTGQVARLGFVYLMQFTALLSINLAVINFFPFPALDGGRVLFLVIEKIKRGPVKREVEGLIHNLGFALLMILVLIVTFRDVAKFSGMFKGIWERIF